MYNSNSKPLTGKAKLHNMFCQAYHSRTNIRCKNVNTPCRIRMIPHQYLITVYPFLCHPREGFLWHLPLSCCFIHAVLTLADKKMGQCSSHAPAAVILAVSICPLSYGYTCQLSHAINSSACEAPSSLARHSSSADNT